MTRKRASLSEASELNLALAQAVVQSAAVMNQCFSQAKDLDPKAAPEDLDKSLEEIDNLFSKAAIDVSGIAESLVSRPSLSGHKRIVAQTVKALRLLARGLGGVHEGLQTGSKDTLEAAGDDLAEAANLLKSLTVTISDKSSRG